jgi:hypothetical protein
LAAGFGAAAGVEGFELGELGVVGAAVAGFEVTAAMRAPGRRATAGGRRVAARPAGGFAAGPGIAAWGT